MTVTPTYIPLATITLGSAQGSVTFGSIPATYRDLVLVVNGTATTTAGYFMYFNSDTGANYTRVGMYGTGSTNASYAETSAIAFEMSSTVVSSSIIQIMDYSASDKHKTRLTRSGPSNNLVLAQASRWANAAAITSISLSRHTFNAGSTFSLYGIH